MATEPPITQRTDDNPSATAPAQRRPLRIEQRNATVSRENRPHWMRTRFAQSAGVDELLELVSTQQLHTVCQEAVCPNLHECWSEREATFLVGGSVCSRRCDFCAIDTGRPQPLDRAEPARIAESVQRMRLRYATVTGVARDDLPDGGAWLYAETVHQIHTLNPGTSVEVLVPDLHADPERLECIFASHPEVFAHNIETVPRLFRSVRPAFAYARSLDVIAQANRAGLVSKSNLILGLGEQRSEISQTLRDLVEAGCQLLTVTQYLRPSAGHRPVSRWVHPKEFVEIRAEALALGFEGVLSGPLVRSSYRAGLLYKQARPAAPSRGIVGRTPRIR